VLLHCGVPYLGSIAYVFACGDVFPLKADAVVHVASVIDGKMMCAIEGDAFS